MLPGHEVGPRARDPPRTAAKGAQRDTRAARGPVASGDRMQERGMVTRSTLDGLRRPQVRPAPQAGRGGAGRGRVPSATTARRSRPRSQRGRARGPGRCPSGTRPRPPGTSGGTGPRPLREAPRPQAVPAWRGPRTTPSPRAGRTFPPAARVARVAHPPPPPRYSPAGL